MSSLYGKHQRELQERFGTVALADRLERVAVHRQIDETNKAFIEGRDMFFLSTVDSGGRPTVSYKGGDPGFVRVLDPQTIAFPSYNGNGMFYSMGNVSASGQVGLLFIDFETPHRLRLQGGAAIDPEDPLLGDFCGAELVVRVTVTDLFVNCPRYVHRYGKVEASRYVPRDGEEVPVAEWKRIDALQDVLSEQDRAAARRAGLLSPGEYAEKVGSGKG